MQLSMTGFNPGSTKEVLLINATKWEIIFRIFPPLS